MGRDSSSTIPGDNPARCHSLVITTPILLACSGRGVDAYGMLKKLLALDSDQERIDLVAADFNSKADLFAEVGTFELLEALGISPDEGDMEQYMYARDFRLNDAWDESLVEDLAPYVTPERLKVIAEAHREDSDDLELTAHEERVMQLLQDIDRCEHNFPDFAIRDWALDATDGTVLSFRGHVGDAGEVYDLLGPYELREGYPEIDGVEFDSFFLKHELAGLRLGASDNKD